MVFTSTTPWKPRNVKIFQKVRNWRNWILSVPEFPYAEKINHLSFVNISPTSVIDTSTERASRVLQHGNQKIWFFQKKVRNWIWLVFWLMLKSFNQLSRSRHAPICRHRGCIVVPLRVDIYLMSLKVSKKKKTQLCYFQILSHYFIFNYYWLVM